MFVIKDQMKCFFYLNYNQMNNVHILEGIRLSFVDYYKLSCHYIQCVDDHYLE